jgi:hypothetical protein
MGQAGKTLDTSVPLLKFLDLKGEVGYPGFAYVANSGANRGQQGGARVHGGTGS